jgi:hypothetical protein
MGNFGVKLIDSKDYPALLISNTTIQSSPIGFDLHFGFCLLLQVIIKRHKKDTVNGNSFVCAVDLALK